MYRINISILLHHLRLIALDLNLVFAPARLRQIVRGLPKQKKLTEPEPVLVVCLLEIYSSLRSASTEEGDSTRLCARLIAARRRWAFLGDLRR